MMRGRMERMRRVCGRYIPVLFALWAWASSAAIFAAVGERLAGFRAALESITAGELQEHVNFLADDTLEGREAGTRGGLAAGDSLAARLSALGLPGGGPNHSYFQPLGPNFRNVLALLEGSDPELRSQVIVVGAHYDHLGYGRKGHTLGPAGVIYNGADDNASGTAGLLELAEALTRLPEPPRRSVLLAFWDAEEKGMLGSKHWVAHPTVPLQQVVLMINLDMIGRLRNDRLMLFGTRSAFGMRRLVSTQNEPGLAIDFRPSVLPKADHYPFFQKNIPVLMFHTDLHSDYHRPTDDAQLINAPGIERVVRLLLGVVCEVADRDQPPRFRAEAISEQQASQADARAAKPEATPELPPPDDGRPLRVGIRWRSDDAEPGAAILTQVVPDSPAARAGLQPEDRIYQVNGRDFADDAELERLLRTLPGPIRLLVERKGRLRTAEIQFAAPRRRAA